MQFANLPIKLLMPSSFSNITEIALKTIPSASKVSFFFFRQKYSCTIGEMPYFELGLA